ncbi:hypothetical protein FOZ62_001928, partial [Perkinsus olseni]
MLPMPSVRPTHLDGTYLRPKLAHKALRQLMSGADLRTGVEVVEIHSNATPTLFYILRMFGYDSSVDAAGNEVLRVCPSEQAGGRKGLQERSKCHTGVESDGRSTSAGRGSTRALNAFSTSENGELVGGQARRSRLGPEERRRFFERLCEPRRDYGRR